MASSRLNMSAWLDAPAGKHGFVQMKGDDLQFENGRPVKFWGVNICSDRPFVQPAQAAQWAGFLAGYGINAVRFHKFTWEATDGYHSTRLTDAKWKNFDYFSAKLRGKGIYYSWSHIYGHRVQRGDSSRLLAYAEVAGTNFPWSHLNGTTASLVNFAEDLQTLNIELTVNMLNHRNPHTGLRYADDPALAFIELQNEDNIFWSAIEATLKQTPTYRALLCQKFSRWLRKKYGSTAELTAAWGAGNLPDSERLEKENVYPHPNHGIFSYESEKAAKAGVALPRHITDRALFLYSEQTAFYTRFEKAVRNTGYKGLIVGSCWQAGSGLAHLLNLHADYRAGVIDRHNYFGGGTGHSLQAGKVMNAAMVAAPGSGLLSTGFQQVADRPFFISEWMSLIPNEWTAESAPLIAAYGLGLQGWDASFAFAMDFAHYTPTVQSGHGVYNVTSPTQLALYPALAAMVYRNDVAEGPIVARRSVTVENLEKGQLPFFEKVEQEADVKRLQSAVSPETLAAGRVVLSFNEKDKMQMADTSLVTAEAVRSATGQLRWQKGPNGFFTINTAGTQGIVGFLPTRVLSLNDLQLSSENKFAVVLVSSLEKANGLAGARRLMITTVARARNTGMQYNDGKTELLKVGHAPILLEPVKVQLTFRAKKKRTVYALDHSGHRTGQTIPFSGTKLFLDGAKYKTLYYEVVQE